MAPLPGRHQGLDQNIRYVIRTHCTTTVLITATMLSVPHVTDYGFPTTRPVLGETLSRGRWARLWLDWFVDAAIGEGNDGSGAKVASAPSPSPALASTLWHVRMLLAPPTDMFAPRAVLSVVGARMRAWVSNALARGSH